MLMISPHFRTHVQDVMDPVSPPPHGGGWRGWVAEITGKREQCRPTTGELSRGQSAGTNRAKAAADQTPLYRTMPPACHSRGHARIQTTINHPLPMRVGSLRRQESQNNADNREEHKRTTNWNKTAADQTPLYRTMPPACHSPHVDMHVSV